MQNAIFSRNDLPWMNWIWKPVKRYPQNGKESKIKWDSWSLFTCVTGIVTRHFIYLWMENFTVVFWSARKIDSFPSFRWNRLDGTLREAASNKPETIVEINWMIKEKYKNYWTKLSTKEMEVELAYQSAARVVSRKSLSNPSDDAFFSM